MNSPRLSIDSERKVEGRSQNEDGAVNQFLLLRAAALDRRTSKGDVSVLAEIIQRHMKRHSNARASYTHLTTMTGLSRRAAINSARRLIELGYINIGRLGCGTRPTEYVPNWALVASSELQFTSTSGEVQFTTVVNSSSPLEALEVNSASPHNPTYRTGRQAGLRESRNDDTPDPLPAPDGAAGSRDPFNEFWQIYPRKYQKPKARATWDRLAPDAELADRIIEAAGRWAEHYAEHRTDKKWMPTPANWLAGERYDEDLPAVYEDPKEAAIAKAKDKPKKPQPTVAPQADNDDIPDFMVGSPSLWPVGRYIGEFVGGAVDNKGSDIEVMLDFRVSSPGQHCGKVFKHRFYPQAFIKSYQDEGQATLENICAALGVSGVDDVDVLIGKPLTASADGRAVTYAPLLASDAA